ncbi:MAG: DUF6782 family putative metallopeptidase [Pseudomonadota bacterium]
MTEMSGCALSSTEPDNGSGSEPQPLQPRIAHPDDPNDPDAHVSLSPSMGLGADVLQNARVALADNCLQPGETPTSDAERDLATIYDSLQKTSIGRGLVDGMKTGLQSLCAHDRMVPPQAAGTFSSQLQIAAIRPAGSDNNFHRRVEFAAHEIRHANQGQHPELDWIRMRRPHESLAMTAIIEADAAAHMLAVSWQREQAGETGAWNPKRDPIYTGVATAFEASMERSVAANGQGAKTNPGAIRKAMGEAFRAWIDDPQLMTAYTMTLDANERYRKGISLPGSPNPTFTPELQSLPRPERIIALMGTAAGDENAEPYLTAADVRAARDRAHAELDPPAIRNSTMDTLLERRSLASVAPSRTLPHAPRPASLHAQPSVKETPIRPPMPSLRF